MCMGTIVMSNLRRVRVAAADGYAGAAHLCETDPYIRSKNMEVLFEEGPLERVQLTLHAYFELAQCRGQANRVVEVFQKQCPKAVKIAMEYYRLGYLDRCVRDGADFCEVFNDIVGHP